MSEDKRWPPPQAILLPVTHGVEPYEDSDKAQALERLDNSIDRLCKVTAKLKKARAAIRRLKWINASDRQEMEKRLEKAEFEISFGAETGEIFVSLSVNSILWNQKKLKDMAKKGASFGSDVAMMGIGYDNDKELRGLVLRLSASVAKDPGGINPFEKAKSVS